MVDTEFSEKDLDPDLPKIGWVCTYTPEEVIHAAGFHPFRILEEESSTKLADTYLHHNLCPYARSCLDFGLKAEDSTLKGMVIIHSCDAMRGLYHSWQHYVSATPFVHFMNVPKDTGPLALEYFTQEVQKLRTALETHFNKKIEDSTLWEVIDLYNESRTLMMELNELRKNPELHIKGTTVFKVAQASQKMPKEAFNKKLKSFLEEIKNQKEKKSLSKGPRIMIVGSLLANSQIIEVAEDAGASVVCDDLCSGSRYFERNVEKGEDPIKAISSRYLLKAPCARMKNTELRLERGKKLIEDFQVDGIIYQTVKFCDNHLYDYPLYHEFFQNAGLPVLQIEEDFAGGNRGQIRTRIEAFVEML
jgi:bzd-type benzoyl-CoA reductase N subunit